MDQPDVQPSIESLRAQQLHDFVLTGQGVSPEVAKNLRWLSGEERKAVADSITFEDGVEVNENRVQWLANMATRGELIDLMEGNPAPRSNGQGGKTGAASGAMSGRHSRSSRGRYMSG